MANVEQLVPADRATVWAALADPRTYPEWLPGAKKIRDVDDHWPAIGAAFHHRVGFGPLTLDDRTTLVAFEPERRLVLRIRATFAILACVTFELHDVEGGTLVRFEEEPARRLIGNLVRPVMDPLTHARNRVALQKLADFVGTGAVPAS